MSDQPTTEPISAEQRKQVTRLVMDDLEFRMVLNSLCDAKGCTLNEMYEQHPKDIADLLDTWFDPGLDTELHFSLDPDELAGGAS